MQAVSGNRLRTKIYFEYVVLERLGNDLGLYHILLEVFPQPGFDYRRLLDLLLLLRPCCSLLCLFLHSLALQMCNVLVNVHIHLLGPDFVQLFLIVLDALLLIRSEFGEILFGRFGEGIGEPYLLDPPHHFVLVDFGLEVEEDGEEQLFLRVDELLVEAKALDLREVNVTIFREDIVSRKSYNWLLLPIVEAVEDDGSFARIDNQFSLHRLEGPVYIGVAVSVEAHFKLLQIVYYILGLLLRDSLKVYYFLLESPVSPMCSQKMRQRGMPAKQAAKTKHVRAMFRQAERR